MPQQLHLLPEQRATYATQRDETERAAAIENLRETLADPTCRNAQFLPHQGAAQGDHAPTWALV